MKDCFICGALLGMLAGAILVYSSPKTREVMKKGEEVLKDAEKSIKEQMEKK